MAVTKTPVKAVATSTRFDHSNCKHAKSGAEGKKARAACRKEHALKAAAAAKRKPRAPRATKAKAADVEPKLVDMSNVTEPADA